MPTTRADHSTEQSSSSTGAVGVAVFAAMLMILGGTMQALQGLVALVDDTFYVVGQEYLFEFDLTTWGWVHLVLGALVAVAGLALFQGATWARTGAIIMVSFGIITNFAWMPYYPLWSTTLIALDVFVIWALTAHGRDLLAG